ncbi:ARM repeat-containing protein [Nadsonia fulvescens var. elongata DSM 6958]|uniref:ARM repeat-containing protein n=1 Tax=Nadsonia fulvescens var. elongata DSM 6958 TaxID=857566 RepID=A0A1E3PGG6_9ASCO|nr:ARM repeat-containing protein [Nadsonia fulvescens var. elongata DSM 6958]
MTDLTATSRNQRRKELFELNIKVWDGIKDSTQSSSNLDSSLKKNTAFIRRLRTSLNADSQKTLLNEIKTLSIEKYLSEVINASVEGIQKCNKTSDVYAATEVISVIHQRFGLMFTVPLLELLLDSFSEANNVNHLMLTAEKEKEREKEKSARVVHQRICLKNMVELWLTGVFVSVAHLDIPNAQLPRFMRKLPTTNTDPTCLLILKYLLSSDIIRFSSVTILVMLIKNFGPVIANIPKKPKFSETAESEEDLGLVRPEIQLKFKTVFSTYTEELKKKTITAFNKVVKKKAANEKAYISTGKILDDREEALEELQEQFEHLQAGLKSLCELLDIEFPEFKEEENDEQEKFITKISANEEELMSVWDDEEQRKFYEELIDLKEHVKLETLGLSTADIANIEANEKKAKTSQVDALEMENIAQELEKMKIDIDIQSDLLESSESKRSQSEEVEEDVEEQDVDVGYIMEEESKSDISGEEVSQFLQRLDTASKRELVDESAVSYCSLHNKRTKNRLVRYLEDASFANQFLIPFYSRFLATLNPYFPEITNDIIDILDNKIRGQNYHNKITKKDNFSNARRRNILFLSELTKFDLVPRHVILHKISTGIKSLDKSTASTIAYYLEGCGRYLAYKRDTAAIMANLLSILQESSSKKLRANEQMIIQQALYYVKPSSGNTLQKTERPIIERYIRKLIYSDLKPTNYETVLKRLRKLDWKDSFTLKALKKVFRKVWRVSVSNIKYLAYFLRMLRFHHPEFVLYIVEQTLEDTRDNLERYSFVYNERIAQAKYLGELYNLKIINSQVIFDVMYTIATLGHPNGRPMPGVDVSIDPRDDFFRVRLILTILDACGSCFKSGSLGAKMSLFLAFLQYYYLTKESPTIDISHHYNNTLKLMRPKIVIHKKLDVAAQELETAVRASFGHDIFSAMETEVDEDMDDFSNANFEANEEDLNNNNNVATLEITSEIDADMEYQDDIRRRAKEEDEQAELEFDREFQQLLNESLGTRKYDKKTNIDLSAPSTKEVEAVLDSATDNSASGKKKKSKNKVAYALVTKKGTKQQFKSISFPKDSEFVVSLIEQKEKSRLEKQQIRDFVLNYNNTLSTPEPN